MRQTESTLFNRRVRVFILTGAFVLLAIFFGLRRTPPPTEIFTIKETPHSTPYLAKQLRLPSRAPLQPSTLPPFRSDFYRRVAKKY